MANDTSGIMALPAMDQQQGPGPAAQGPEAQMVFDSMRQNLSPKEISDELLSAGAQADPQAVAEFRAELEELDVPPEILDLINQLVDEALANPENYEQIRQKYLAQGVSEDMLPEQFEPEFFAALNIAVDQLRGEPAGPQAFAKGGIAELKPVAQAIASYGRNGDTMLAHITPAEARMLRQRGGSGTINPVTGLPEFANIFSKIASAGKKFLRSTAGRMITTIALGALLGPAAAAAMGVGAGTAAGVAISGFVGSAGSTLLAGGSARDALKAGATSALLAGAGAALFTDMPLTGKATMTPGEAFQTQVGRAANVFEPPTTVTFPEGGGPTLPSAPELPTQATLPGSSVAETYPVRAGEPMYNLLPDSMGNAPAAMPGQAPATSNVAPQYRLSGQLDLGPGTRPPAQTIGREILAPEVGKTIPVPTAAPSTTAVPSVITVPPPVAVSPAQSALSGGTALDAQVAARSTVPTVSGSIKTIGEGLGLGQGPASWETLKQGVSDLFMPQGASQEAIRSKAIELQRSVAAQGGNIPYADAVKEVSKTMVPTALRSYGPMAAAGLGIMGLAGGFRSQPATESPLAALFGSGPGSANYLLASNPSQYFIQYLPGVGYVSGRPRFAEGGIVDVPAFAEGGKTLSTDEKMRLANALQYAQQNGTYAFFNGLVESMGVTEQDLLNNFPAISAANIAEARNRGALVPATETKRTASSSNSLSDARDINTRTQTDGGTGVSNTSTTSTSTASTAAAGKTLTDPQKYALADVLVEAQRTGNYAPFNAELQRLGLTQSDLLANFPNINLTGIQEHTGRGVVAPMYQGDVATGVRGLTEGQRTDLGNVFLKAQETGDYGEFNRLLGLYRLQPADLVKLYPNLSLQKIQQFQQEKPEAVSFPAPRVDQVFGVGTPAVTQVEVPSATLRTGQRPMDSRSEAIRQYLGGVGPGAKIESIVSAMDRADISPEQVADVMGMGYAPVQAQYFKAKNAMILGGYDVDPATGRRIPVAPAGGIAALPAAPQAQPYSGIMSGMMPLTPEQKNMLGSTLVYGQQSGNFTPFNQTAAMYGATQPDVLYNFPAVNPQGIQEAVGRGAQLPGGITAPTVPAVMQRAPVEFMPPKPAPAPEVPPTLMNMGGIAALGGGGYPRRTGQIDGPGTETSDSIPAMLSDGEFVMTARAVRGAGNGDRRAGAKKMYALMHRLEKNAARG